jgi:hypothetical protein
MKTREELSTAARAVFQVATYVMYFADFTATFAIRFALIKRRLHNTYPLVLLSVYDYVVV